MFSVFFSKNLDLYQWVWVAAASSLPSNRPEAGAMLTSLSPITPPPAVSDMHYPWNYFHQTDSPSSSSAAAGPLTSSGGAFSWYGSRWPSNGELKSPFSGVTHGNYFPSYDTSCFGSTPTHHQLNVASNGPTQVSHVVILLRIYCYIVISRRAAWNGFQLSWLSFSYKPINMMSVTLRAFVWMYVWMSVWMLTRVKQIVTAAHGKL